MKYDLVASPWGDGSIYSIPVDGAGNTVGSAVSIRCSGKVEYADRRGASDFPDSWGAPIGAPYSEERAAWIHEHVQNGQAGKRRSAQAALAAVLAVDLP